MVVVCIGPLGGVAKLGLFCIFFVFIMVMMVCLIYY